MILTTSNTPDPGLAMNIMDANGVEWKHCLACDTETGVIVRWVFNEQGEILCYPLITDGVKEVIQAAPPLRFIGKDTKKKLSPRRLEGCNCEDKSCKVCLSEAHWQSYLASKRES